MENGKTIFAIESLIGGGKSTLIKNLDCVGHKEIEPIHEFTRFCYREYEFNPLYEFYKYKNAKNHAITQLHIINSIKKWYKFINWDKHDVFIIERGYDSSSYFINAMYEADTISFFEKAYLLDSLDGAKNEIIQTVKSEPITHMIVINTPIPTCIENIKKRNRFYELCSRSLEPYLNILNDTMTDYIDVYRKKLGESNIYVLDYHPGVHKEAEKIIQSVVSKSYKK